MSTESIFTAEIQYDEKAIKRLCQVRRSTFELGKRLAAAAAGLLLIVFGLFLSRENRLGIVMMLGGSILLMGMDAPAAALAERVIQQFRGKAFPEIRYFFSGTGITTNEMPEECPYRKIVALIEDGEYLFLFQNRMAAFMIDKASLGEQLPAFKEFLAEKTGLQFQEPFRLKNMNLRRLSEALRILQRVKGRDM